jgi:hypothetical protein
LTQGPSRSKLRRSDASALRRPYARGDIALSLGDIKTDGWLSRNLDNPLRDWLDQHEQAAIESCAAYSAAPPRSQAPPGSQLSS